MTGVCCPTLTENLMRLSPIFRDYWGEQVARFVERTDVFCKAGCFVPRFYHAPSSDDQFVGVAARGYIPYVLALPIGSYVLGFLHTTSSAPGAPGFAPAPPNPSGFTCQITDLSVNHKWFTRPMPEAWFINDFFAPGGNNTYPPYPLNTQGYTWPNFPRLLAVPYPIVPPGRLKVEFWNSLASVNTDVQMTFLVMVPNNLKGGGLNATSGT